MKISVIGPVKNEAPWIGFSIMAVLPYVHEFVYALDSESTDGTRELLAYIKDTYAWDELKVLNFTTFKPSDLANYNEAFNMCIRESTGDAVWFLHPDMICTNAEKIADIKEGPLAWWTNLTSFAGYDTVITRGRAKEWKNIQLKRFGLHYFGGYGSQNEDFYFKDITGNAHIHYGTQFQRYPYKVGNSGLQINHYCEMKPYERRLEKMKACLRTLYPRWEEEQIHEMAIVHPRVTLNGGGTDIFGRFEFKKIDIPLPDVFTEYREEFDGVLMGVPA